MLPKGPRGTSPQDFSLTDVDLEKPAYANFTFAPAIGLWLTLLFNVVHRFLLPKNAPSSVEAPVFAPRYTFPVVFWVYRSWERVSSRKCHGELGIMMDLWRMKLCSCRMFFFLTNLIPGVSPAFFFFTFWVTHLSWANALLKTLQDDHQIDPNLMPG